MSEPHQGVSGKSVSDVSGVVKFHHYSDVIMGAIASQITSLTIVYSTVYSGVDQRKHQSSASLVFVRGIHRRSVIFPHKGTVTHRMFPFDDVIVMQIHRPIIVLLSQSQKGVFV